ncbi:hypothetical protein [Spiroplasma endosymbiont of Virgichneumon dumeticola]|uniref:hypothetical protein n=1 Tax=Spiroplasma endosymbiont of Virgichneumon dumeticola TaxID=3139323 RepID=UPI0035C8EEE8
MAVNIQTNLNNTEKLVEAPEFIEFFKQSNSPWASFFPIEMINSTTIEFIIKLPKDPKIKVLPWIDKSTRLDVSYAETDKIQKFIEKLYVAGETISAVDLLGENRQNLLDTMQYEIANDLANKLASDDTNIISQFATKVIIDKATELKEQAIKYLEAMLSSWNTLFQLRNDVNSRFFITNSTYDSLVYLADNKGLITDNQIAQQLRLNGNDLYIKGVLCQIVMDDYMTFTNDKNESEIMSFILATPKAMKRYMVQQTIVYVQEIADDKVGRAYKVGGEVLGQSIPYMSKKETTSRWMLCGIIKTDKTDLKTKLTTLITDFTAKTDKINKELSENIMYAKEVNGLNPGLVNPIITFFSDAQGKNNITSQKQKAGDLYVVISTSVNDLNYKGSTNPIKIMIK